MRIISEALAHKLRAHACWFADLDEVAIPSAAVDDEQVEQWSAESYDRDLDNEQNPRNAERAEIAYTNQLAHLAANARLDGLPKPGVRPRVLRRRLGLAFLGALLAGCVFGTGIAKASPETDYFELLTDAGMVIYDTDAALTTGYAICAAFNTTTGDVVAANLFLHTAWADVPDMATANAWVMIAGATLCPWHFHPERILPNGTVRA